MVLKKNDVKPVSYNTIKKNTRLGSFFKVNEEDEEEAKRKNL
jgi:hypothetical protein